MTISTDNTHVVIVTGGASGIGEAVCVRFARDYAHVVIVDVNDVAGTDLASKLGEQGANALFCHADVSSEAEMRAVFARTISHFGRLDAIVNNAGVNFVKPYMQTTIQDWEHVIGVDLRGTHLGCQLAIAQFLRQGAGGAIVNISSVHSQSTLPAAAPYAAAKGGVTQLTKSLAIEFGPANIRVNAVCPGLTTTQIWQDLLAGGSAAEVERHWMSNIPLGRAAEPREIANLVAWLCSDEASYVTGSNIMIDGGMTAMLTSFEGA